MIIVSIAGPGITSFTTAIGEAYFESVPLICIGVNNFKVDLDVEKGLIHEMPDSRGLFDPITVVSVRAETEEQLANMIYHSVEKGREIAKPIYIEAPSDVFSAIFENNTVITMGNNILEDYLLEDDNEIEKIVEKCAEKLKQASLPVIHVGWGGQLSDVHEELIEICENCGVMVIPTIRAKGILEENNAYNAGPIWERARQVTEIAEKSDLVIAVGTRLSMLNTRGGTLPINGDLYHIVNDPKYFGITYPKAENLKCDCKKFLKLLSEKVKEQKNEARCEKVKTIVSSIKEQWDSKLEEKIPAVSKLMKDIKEAYDDDTHFVMDMCQEGYWLSRYIHANKRMTFQSSFYFGTLGPSIPMAIGASNSRNGNVVAICGDGGFIYGFNELASAKKYGIPIKILLFNNNRFDAIIRAHQARYKNESNHYQLYNPDFKGISDAFEINYYKTNYKEIKNTICKANKESTSYIIEVISDDIPMFNSIKWEDLNLKL